MTTDQHFKELLANRDMPAPNDHFDDQVMYQLYKEQKRTSLSHRYIRRMYICFGVGFILGLIAMFSITNVVVTVGELELTVPLPVLQVPFVLLALFFIDRLYKAGLIHWNKREAFDK
jgi:hypothetical protein